MEHGGYFSIQFDALKSAPRLLRRERVDALKEDMHTLDEQATEFIDELWRFTETNPPPSADELLRFTKQKSLPRPIETRAIDAIERYRIQQERIDEILAEYPDPRELFEVCFGKKPEGKIQLTRSAITLNFIVYKDRDYADAFASNYPKDSDKYLHAKKRALESGGCAAPNTNLIGSEGIFTLVRIGSNVEERRTVQHEVQEREVLPGKILYLSDLTQIQVHTENDQPTIHYDWSQVNAMVRGARAVSPSQEYVIEVADETTDPTLGIDDLEVRIRSHEGEEFLTIRTDTVSSRSEIKNHSLNPIHLTLQSFAKETRIIDPERVKKTLLHEIQHQWNKLFIPTNPRPKQPKETIDSIVSDPSLSPEASFRAVLDFMFDRSRRDTQLGETYQRAEIRGRDEVLAFYRDGRSTAAIKSILRTRLYDYFEQDDLEKLKKEIRSYLKRYSYLRNDLVPEAPLPQFSEADIDDYLSSLKEQYFHSIDQGLRAIERLEQQGASRERILAKFYKANLPEWPMIARRYAQRQHTNSSHSSIEGIAA